MPHHNESALALTMPFPLPSSPSNTIIPVSCPWPMIVSSLATLAASSLPPDPEETYDMWPYRFPTLMGALNVQPLNASCLRIARMFAPCEG